MTPQQIRDAITASPELTALAQPGVRDDGAIARILTESQPPRLRTHMISERGVRQALTVVEGALFLKLLRELSTATEAPTWLANVLTAMQVPSEVHWAYLDTLSVGWEWLRSDGLDLGSTQVQAMLDLIASGNSSLSAACAKLKALGTEQDPVPLQAVSDALNEVQQGSGE